MVRFMKSIRNAFDVLMRGGRGKAPVTASYAKHVKGTPRAMGEGCRLFDVEFCGAVHLGRYVSLWGPNVKLMAQRDRIEIGSFSSVAQDVLMITYNHDISKATTYFIRSNIFKEKGLPDIVSKGPIILEEDVWIGAGAKILGGVRIGRGAVVGAGSVVTNDVAPYTIVGGNPANPIRTRFSEESIRHLESSRWWTWSEEEIKRRRDFFLQSHT